MRYTLKLLSEITGIPKITLRRRCIREGGWGGKWEKGNGGNRRVFDILDLPTDIKQVVSRQKHRKSFPIILWQKLCSLAGTLKKRVNS